MGTADRSHTRWNIRSQSEEAVPLATRHAGGWVRTFRLTILFGVTAVVLIAVAAFIVNLVIGYHTENNLVRIAEENTARDALHIESMVRSGNSMDGMSSSGVAGSGMAMDEMEKPMQHSMSSEGVVYSGAGMDQMQQPGPLSLDFLAGPEGLPKTFPMLVEGFNIVKLNLLDSNDKIVWSTDLGSIGDRRLLSPLHGESEHMHAGISSELQTDPELVISTASVAGSTSCKPTSPCEIPPRERL